MIWHTGSPSFSGISCNRAAGTPVSFAIRAKCSWNQLANASFVEPQNDGAVDVADDGNASASFRIGHHRIEILRCVRQKSQMLQCLALRSNHQDAPLAHS